MVVVEERDYVANMKPSGYRGLHLIIKYPVITALGRVEVLCEIQIRTLAMNMWAVTEHSLRYKYDGMIPDEIHKSLIRTAEAAYTLDTDTNVIRDDILRAEKEIKSHEEIIFDITNSIEDLYKVADSFEVASLYERFVCVLDNNKHEELISFYGEVRRIAQVYKIR
jgi:putative GTP pyrophosphokinase